MYIDNYFYDIVNVYTDAACVFLPIRRSVAKHEAQIVGWSDFVHDLHGAARISYVQWQEANRPKEGALFDETNKSRRLFKTALRMCRQNKTRIESDNKFHDLGHAKERPQRIFGNVFGTSMRQIRLLILIKSIICLVQIIL